MAMEVEAPEKTVLCLLTDPDNHPLRQSLYFPNSSRQLLAGHSEAVVSVAFSPDGPQLASGSGNTTVRLWDLNTQTPLYTCSDDMKRALYDQDGEAGVKSTMSGGSSTYTTNPFDLFETFLGSSSPFPDMDTPFETRGRSTVTKGEEPIKIIFCQVQPGMVEKLCILSLGGLSF